MDSENNLKYKIGITLIPLIGDVTAKKLIAYCGGVVAVFKESKKALLKIPGIGEKAANSIKNQDVISRAEKEVEFIEKNKISTFYFLDENFPFRLTHCADSPIILYGKGNFNLNQEKILSVVGTRNITTYGRSFCEKFIPSIKSMNPLIVSGLAYGIDIAAHKISYKNNITTVGVLAHGLDQIYPKIHRNDAEKMIENGGLLTEFMSGSNPDRENFPKRNRIVAGLADATIVVESASKGGSLITADIANSYSREVFAVPGKIGDQYSEGCNWLIKTNKARLLTSYKDLEYIMNWSINPSSNKQAIQKQLFIELTPQEQLLVDIITKHQKINIDKLALEAKITAGNVSSVLLNLEFSGVVRSLPGKMYVLN